MFVIHLESGHVIHGHIKLLMVLRNIERAVCCSRSNLRVRKCTFDCNVSVLEEGLKKIVSTLRKLFHHPLCAAHIRVSGRRPPSAGNRKLWTNPKTGGDWLRSEWTISKCNYYSKKKNDDNQNHRQKSPTLRRKLICYGRKWLCKSKVRVLIF